MDSLSFQNVFDILTYYKNIRKSVILNCQENASSFKMDSWITGPLATQVAEAERQLELRSWNPA